jgi:hypothetical protein
MFLRNVGRALPKYAALQPRYFHKQGIRCVPAGETNILGRHSIGHSKQKHVYIHVSYSERCPSISLHSSLNLTPNIVLPSRM